MTTVCFVGAGSAVFTRQLLRDLFTYDDLGPLTLSLHDIDERRLRLAHDLAHLAARHHDRPVVVRAEPELRSALEGADFVVNTVNVGGHAATVTDFEVPARYGLRQTIGDTLGVGGVFRGLRTFGVLDKIATSMAETCPDAWLLNYSNPMAMNVQYLGERFPDLRVLGLCHSVFWTVHDLCELVGVAMDGVRFHSAGVNHQAWVLEWERNGESLYPLLDERIASDPQLRRRVRVDMYRRLGFYPTETSEHSSEYVPWYLHDDAEIERLRIPVGDYLGISAANLADIDSLIPAVEDGRYVEPDDEPAEYAPQVVHSLTTGRRTTIQATVPNAGLVPNLPTAAGVEVPCVLDAEGAHPQRVAPLPAQCAALNRHFLSVVDLTVGAAVEGRPELVRQALMVDPNTSATLTVEEIWRVADDMVATHSDLLPEPLRVPLALRGAASSTDA